VPPRPFSWWTHGTRTLVEGHSKEAARLAHSSVVSDAARRHELSRTSSPLRLAANVASRVTFLERPLPHRLPALGVGLWSETDSSTQALAVEVTDDSPYLAAVDVPRHAPSIDPCLLRSRASARRHLWCSRRFPIAPAAPR
jgi:hypothetical protein